MPHFPYFHTIFLLAHLLNLIAFVAEVIFLDLHGLDLLLDGFHLDCVLAGDLAIFKYELKERKEVLEVFI